MILKRIYQLILLIKVEVVLILLFIGPQHFTIISA